MPLLNITADSPVTQMAAGGPVLPALRQALATDPGPVTIMVHGFRYQPGHPVHCPHETLFSLGADRRSPGVDSWPRRLGLRGRHGEGIGIGFGWPSRGGLRAVHARA